MEGGRKRHRGAVGLVVAVALACATACGSEDGSDEARQTAPVVGQGLPPEVQHPVTTAVDRLQRAFLDEDYAGLCAEITAAAARKAGAAAHGNPTDCRSDLQQLLVLIRDGGGWRHRGAPRVTDVQVAGARATATVALDRRWQARIPFTRQDGRWRMNGFFGAATGQARQTTSATPDADFPAPGAQPVEVLDADGTPCPELSGRYPHPSGGCRIRMSAPIAPFTILAPFGDFEFDRCSIDYRVRADATGRTWTEGFEVSTTKRESACGDVNACYDYTREVEAPWRGRLHPQPDGSFLHRVDMCLQTCVGDFVGELEVRLWQEDGNWRAEPVDGGGSTGFRFDSPLRVRGDFDLEVAGT